MPYHRMTYGLRRLFLKVSVVRITSWHGLTLMESVSFQSSASMKRIKLQFMFSTYEYKDNQVYGG